MQPQLFRRRPASARPALVGRRSLCLENLEQRNLLAVMAANDNYVIDEGAYFLTNFSSPVPSRSIGGWTIFDEIPRTGLNANTYPDANQAPVRWYDRTYNVNQPSYSSWDGAVGPELSAPFAHEVVNALGLATPVDVPAATENAFLARKTFSLTPQQAAAAGAHLRMACDDGCVFYLNGREIIRAGLPSGPLSPNTLANPNELSENGYYHTIAPLNLAARGVTLYPDGSNVLAIEVHNEDPASSDIGFDVQLFLSDGRNDTRLNDLTAGSTLPLSTYFWNGVANPAITITDEGPVYSLDGEILLGEVEFEPDGTFAFDPVIAGPGISYSGPASFQYVLRDSSTPPQTSIGTVNITINPVNDSPVSTGERYSIDEGDSVNITQPAGPLYIEAESDWFYSHDGSNQDALNPEWKAGPAAGFNPAGGAESGWVTTAAPGPLGFGDNPATQLSRYLAGSATQITTFYFFRQFDVSGPVPEMLRMGLNRDDCAAVYINGVEVHRTDTLPAAQTSTTLCNGPVVDGTAEDIYFESTFRTAGLNLLPTGNTIAVEVHQVSPVSSDTRFDLYLRNGAVGLLSNDIDEDDPQAELRVELLDTSEFTPAVGQLTVNPDGTFAFIPANENVIGSYSFTYQVLDDGQPLAPIRGSLVATATIDIASVSDPILAVSESYEVSNTKVLDVSAALGVLANDDGDGALVVRVLNSGGEVIAGEEGEFSWGGTTDFLSDGSFFFDPANGFVGTFQQVYTIADALGQTGTATLTINVTGSATADLNGDQAVNLADLALLLNQFGNTGAGNSADLDGDGRIGVNDAVRLRNDFTAPAAPAAAAIVATARRTATADSRPEPTARRAHRRSPVREAATDRAHEDLSATAGTRRRASW